jgi:hypothetical protein
MVTVVILAPVVSPARHFLTHPHRERSLLLAFALGVESEGAWRKVVKPCSGRIIFCCRPIESVPFHASVLAIIESATATERRIEARAAAVHERSVRGLTVVGRVVSDAPIVFRHLSRLVVCRESPSGAQ